MKKKECASVSYIDTLPLDILSNILSRIPVKHLLCLKCVCKSWMSMISSPEFAHSHFLQSLPSESGRFLVFSGIADIPMEEEVVEEQEEEEEEEEDDGAEICDLNFYSLHLDLPESPTLKSPLHLYLGSNKTSIIGSCNGLECYFLLKSEVIILVNPETRTFYKIRKAPRCHDQGYYGFGYDLLSEDYKLVRILNGPHREMRVYSLNSNSWTLIKEENSLRHDFTPDCGVVINNHLLHWICHSSGQPAIVSYDLCTEQWGQVHVLDDIMNRNGAELRDLDGYLCLFTLEIKENLVGVWLMKEYGVKESWVRLC